MECTPLIVLDLGGTIGHVVGHGADVPAILSRLAPESFPEEIVIYEAWSVLNRVPELTEDVIREVCDDLCIPREDWPEGWPTVDFEAFPETADCLARLAGIGTVVALTNQSVTARPAVARVAEDFGDYISAIYTSYNLRSTKPAQWLWRHVAAQHNRNTTDIIHIGDRWAEDVIGPLTGGARAAVYLNDEIGAAPLAEFDQRVLHAQDLTTAVDLVESLALGSSTPGPTE